MPDHKNSNCCESRDPGPISRATLTELFPEPLAALGQGSNNYWQTSRRRGHSNVIISRLCLDWSRDCTGLDEGNAIWMDVVYPFLSSFPRCVLVQSYLNFTNGLAAVPSSGVVNDRKCCNLVMQNLYNSSGCHQAVE